MAKQFTPQQMEIVSSIVERFGTDPEDITFFDGNEPFLGYETSCVMLTALKPQIMDVDHTIEPPAFPDYIQVKVRITDDDGRKRTGLGVISRNEKDRDGNELSEQQLLYTAQSRGLRSAMTAFGIDLMRLHRNEPDPIQPLSANAERNKLLAEVHALGEEIGFINRKKNEIGETILDKSGWQKFLMSSFGKGSCEEINTDDLRSVAALLRTIKDRDIRKAA